MKKISLFLVSILLLTACVPHRQWRTEPVFSSGANPNAKLETRFVIEPDSAKNRLYSLAFLEFKDDGEAWDKRQLDDALREIDEADRRSGHRALVITFVHGWKNNARPTNNNVAEFRVQLNRIAADACGGNAAQCGVVGVYIGWSGDAVDRYWNTVRNMTYANRRDTASHVASLPVGEALFAIMKRAKQGAERASNHSMVVGHSFGGLILEYAISKRMREIGEELHRELGNQTTSDEIKLKTLEDFADLVVLINQAAPAAEAVTLLSQYRRDLQQVNLLRPPKKSDCAAGDPAQDCKALTRPLILSISSESDLATRTILPIAETVFPAKHAPLGVAVHRPDGLEEKQIFTTAAAHTPQLHSHELMTCERSEERRVGKEC